MNKIGDDVYSGIDTDDEKYFDDEDERLIDKEFDELIKYGDEMYNKFIRSQDIKEKSERLSDNLFVTYLMLDEEILDDLKYMSESERNDIQKSLYNRRKYKGGCSMWRDIGIKYYGDRQMWDKMYNWEKEYYLKHHNKKLQEKS